MGNTSQKLNKLLETKEQIRQAIIDKGVEVGEDVVFADYPTKIAAIESGGNGPDYTAVYLARTRNETTYQELFQFSTATEIDCSNGYDSSNVTNMRGMFQYCYYVTTLKINNLVTNNVTDMRNMFNGCKELTSLDLSNFDTSQVTNMYSMFYNCYVLTSLDLSSFDTSNVTAMDNMFNSCYALTELDLSNFKTNNVTDMSSMFWSCKALTSLDISDFDMTNVTDTENMLCSCPKLHKLRLHNCSNDTINKIITSSGFPTGLVDGEKRKMWVSPKYVGDLTVPDGWEFVDCNTGEVIEIIPLYQLWEFRNHEDKYSLIEVTTMVNETHTDLSYMFDGCENLRTINGIHNWNTSNVTNMERMFYSCKSLESLNLYDFNTSNVESMYDMFSECENLKKLNLSNFEVREDCDVDYMLNNCRSLHTLRLDNCNEDTIRKIIESWEFPTGEAEGYEGTRTIYCLEKNVANLTAPDGWVFVDTETGEIIERKPVNYDKGMFSENRKITKVSVMVTSEHDDLENMFYNCENLKTINGIKDWNTSNVTNMERMFYNCRSLESLDLSSFNTSNVESMYDMFSECENLKKLNLSSFKIREDCDVDWMLNNCRRLHTLRLDNCNEGTISKIIGSEEFPIGGADDYEGTRQIFVKEENVSDLTAPDGWEFIDCFTGGKIEPDLYESNQFRDKTGIIEVKTMVNTSHNSLDYMFDGCTALTTVNTTDWDTSNVYNMEYMFRNCTSLTELDLSSFVTSNHNTGMFNYMFYGCTSLETLNIRNFYLNYYDSEEGYMAQEMFTGCTSLHTIYMNNCNAYTIAEIISSLNRVSYKGSQPQIIYCKEDNLIHPGSGFRIQPPSGWRFEYVE